MGDPNQAKQNSTDFYPHDNGNITMPVIRRLVKKQ